MPDETKPSARITSLTVTRLYNLGNYEHVSYSVSVEIPEGVDPRATLEGVVDALRGLKPIRVDYQIQHAQRTLNMSVEERTKHGVTDADLATARLHLDEWEAKVAAQKESLAKFNDLGGSVKHKDAKLNWSDDPFSEDVLF